MSQTHLINIETIRTICQGALGAMSFGAYHQYTSNKMMELNNEKMEIQNKYFMDKMENQHKREMDKMENEHKKEMHEIVNKYEKMFNKFEMLERTIETKQRRWFW